MVGVILEIRATVTEQRLGTGHLYTAVPLPAIAVLLPMVSITYSQPWSEDIKWKIS